LPSVRKRTVRNSKDRRQDSAVASVLGGFLTADRRKGGDRRKKQPRASNPR
jgi:hypothetical protein